MCAVVDTRRQHTHFGETSKRQTEQLGGRLTGTVIAARIVQSALNIRYRATNRLSAFGISASTRQLKTYVVMIGQRSPQTEDFADASTRRRTSASIQMPSPQRSSNLIGDDLESATDVHSRDS
jgi:hypothetical protein